MLFRTSSGTLLNVERNNFISDREYYLYIKSIVLGNSIKPQYKETIVDRLTKIIIRKYYTQSRTIIPL